MKTNLQNRVVNLEQTLAHFMTSTGDSLNRLSREMREFKDEMSDFKDEMSEFKDEMGEFKDEMLEFKNEMHEFKDEMLEFKNEMRDFKDGVDKFKNGVDEFKDEMARDRKAQNEQWGHLANKLGTFAEDISAPNLPRIARTYFNEQQILFRGVRLDVHPMDRPDMVYEFDAVLETQNMVFLLESKYTIRMRDVASLPKLIERFKLGFPQYHHKKLVVIYGTMHLPENIVTHLTKLGIYGMAMGEYTMDLVNFEDVQKRDRA